jgi:UDPglucose 6-dehydrogenase
MNIAMIGTGYVGLVSGACLADFGHHVWGVDTDRDRIERLRVADVPFHEPGLAEMVSQHMASGRLRFTTDLADAIRDSLVIFLAVGTPEGAGGQADMTQVTAAVEAVAAHVDGYRVIVTKSTVPVGTGALIRDMLVRLNREIDCDVVSNPEFLREGSAVSDFLRPDRVVIGTTSDRAAAVMREIYRPLYLIETPIVSTDIETAEMIKYASNAFLAVKISFINEIANLCDRAGADVHVVARAMGLDKRIGPKFLHPGPGFGGSCFPKDTRALSALAAKHDVAVEVVDAAIRANDRQRLLAVTKLEQALGGLAGRHVAILGLAFKPNTSDVREAPAIYVARELVARGAQVCAYDPVAMPEAARALDQHADRVTFAADAYEAVESADAVVIATEWNEFRSLDLARLYRALRRPVILDLRNVLEPERAVAGGFTYYSTGRQAAAAGAGFSRPETTVGAGFSRPDARQS